jgi:hypothetical protein
MALRFGYLLVVAAVLCVGECSRVWGPHLSEWQLLMS